MHCSEGVFGLLTNVTIDDASIIEILKFLFNLCRLHNSYRHPLQRWTFFASIFTPQTPLIKNLLRKATINQRLSDVFTSIYFQVLFQSIAQSSPDIENSEKKG